MNLEGFLLTREWLETSQGQDLVFWLATPRGPLRVTIPDQESVFFLAQEDWEKARSELERVPGFHSATLELKTFDQQDTVACYFRQQIDMNIARSRIGAFNVVPFESDIRPTDRYLMERFITGSVTVVTDMLVAENNYTEARDPRLRPGRYQPSLKVLSLDIETSYTENILYSIGAIVGEKRKVFMVADSQLGAQPGTEHLQPGELERLPSEAAVIQRFLKWFGTEDPDVIVGWSVVGFDLSFLQRRCDDLDLLFTLGRAGQLVRWRESALARGRDFATVPGRVVLDGIEVLRSATYSFESFSLEFVARQLLGRGKLVEDVDARAAEIQDMYRQDKELLAAYNLQDCQLVLDIFEFADLMNFSLQRSALTGLEMDRPGGSVAAFDFLYLPQLHRSGYVAPVVPADARGGAPGGYVLDSEPGLYDHVIVLDFKSLYPSIIRTFHVDPLAMVVGETEEAAIPGYEDALFSRTEAILPGIIKNLWDARDAARRDGRSAMSQAIKIIMNSFYGVLGTPACRFYHHGLVSSITRRGHEILQRTRDLIEEAGYRVIYGDTDSVFVFVGPRDADAVGGQLVDSLNIWWRDHLKETYQIESFLELEYEAHFLKFLMPKIRGSEKGSKKRYAGLKIDGEGKKRLVFKGLESVRSDWSPLAREFQQVLYQKIFQDKPVEDYIRTTVEQLSTGLLDDKLLLRRRLRRKLADYQKNIPPHVRAARKLEQIRAERGLPVIPGNGGWIEYVMTLNGPEPRNYLTSSVDYQFYIDKQLMPVADAILTFKGKNMLDIIKAQLDLF